MRWRAARDQYQQCAPRNHAVHRDVHRESTLETSAEWVSGKLKTNADGVQLQTLRIRSRHGMLQVLISQQRTSNPSTTLFRLNTPSNATSSTFHLRLVMLNYTARNALSAQHTSMAPGFANQNSSRVRDLECEIPMLHPAH